MIEIVFRQLDNRWWQIRKDGAAIGQPIEIRETVSAGQPTVILSVAETTAAVLAATLNLAVAVAEDCADQSCD